MFKIAKLNNNYKIVGYISKCLYDFVIQNMQNTIIIGNDDDVFAYVKNGLWKGTNKHSFPYVDHTSEYANLSPLVCSTEMSLINSPVNIIFINFTITKEIIEKIKHLTNIRIVTNDEHIFQTSIDILSSLSIKFSENRDTNDKTQNNAKNGQYTQKTSRIQYNSNNEYKNIQQNNQKKMQYSSKASYNKVNKNYNDNKSDSQNVQKTILLLKPHVVKSKQHFYVLMDVENEGFTVTYIGRKQYNKDIWEKIYIHHQNESFYDGMCEYLSNNYVYICIVERVDAIETLRSIIGDKDPKKAHPSSLRYKYGLNIDDNGIHASLSVDEFNKDKVIFFATAGFKKYDR